LKRLNNIVTLKSRLAVTHPATLCTMWTDIAEIYGSWRICAADGCIFIYALPYSELRKKLLTL